MTMAWLCRLQVCLIVRGRGMKILSEIDLGTDIAVSHADVFVNVVGGMKISEPASDLAVAMAVASSVRDSSLPADVAFVGELGLGGELR